MRWDANSLSARMPHLLYLFVPNLYSVTLFLPTSSNTAYSLSGIGRFDKILLCPHEDGQEQRLSSASIKLPWQFETNPRSLRYISGSRQRRFIDPPELLFTTLFFLSAFSLPLRLVFTSDGVVVGVVIRSVKRYDLVKIKPTESEAEH